jgi:TatA/E family protein of Tat protein translocase
MKTDYQNILEIKHKVLGNRGLTPPISTCICNSMFGISGEHIIILLVILLVFGPKKLPELGNTLGKAIKNFKDTMDGVHNAEFRKIDPNSGRPKNPKELKTEALAHDEKNQPTQAGEASPVISTQKKGGETQSS